ncbi:MAG: 50S ribosomal protein L17 [Spirochaetales bacterium]|nr:50S ribosomal protein L17 [Spirochaetales bacterium]
MRKGNKVAQLNRRSAHRKAMLANMATSLFEHERIVTTRAKGKALRSYAEKLITRARHSLNDGIKPEQVLHHKREVLRSIKNEDIVVKLFNDIAGRFKERNGGYIRLIHLPPRASDASEMSVVELVERKEPARREPAKKEARKARPSGKSTTAKKEEATPVRKKDEKVPWYKKFRKSKGPDSI